MEVQDTDELLYTQDEAEQMLDYREELAKVSPKDDEQKALKAELEEKFQKLSDLIVEYNDRIDLSANNLTDPSKDEMAALKRLFSQIEDLDFETSDKFRYLTGRRA